MQGAETLRRSPLRHSTTSKSRAMIQSSADRVLATAELISMVFSYLIEDQGKWKGPVANLATVNQSFFHAAVGIVWEHMDSFEPFCSILAPVPPGNVPTPVRGYLASLVASN